MITKQKLGKLRAILTGESAASFAGAYTDEAAKNISKEIDALFAEPDQPVVLFAKRGEHDVSAKPDETAVLFEKQGELHDGSVEPYIKRGYRATEPTFEQAYRPIETGPHAPIGPAFEPVVTPAEPFEPIPYAPAKFTEPISYPPTKKREE